MIDKINKIFHNKYGKSGVMYAAPGRVNLIGEHTDYNNGFVLPGAIDKTITLEILPNGTNSFNVFAADLEQETSFEANDQKSNLSWANYIIGVVMEMKKRGFIVPGFNCVFGGNIPKGGGMSSSAALESAFAYAINDINGFNISKTEMAKIGQMAEHNYAGVRCGIMDQFASLHGEKGKLIKLDCRSLEYEIIPFNPQSYKLLLVDTRIKHALASSEYNVRRSQCEEGVSVIQKKYSQVESLRDVNEQMLEEFKDVISSVVYQRCLYVIQENSRLLRACDALKANDFESFGKEMFGSHYGLSNQYEVSCEQLDFLVETARNFNGVVGARMMGGGFGGCTINLISDSEYNAFIQKIAYEYENKFNKKPLFYEVTIDDGARKL